MENRTVPRRQHGHGGPRGDHRYRAVGRRSSLLTLLPGIRRGGLDRERFERYATPMLTEKEFFIRKAIGWVLREAAKKDPAYVAAWTRSHLDRMSGVTFREAVRRLPAEQAARLQAEYRKPAGS